jgi:DNA-binding transcriptional ArsR family regulator
MAVNQLTEAQLDDTFSALADPTRRAILGRLAEGKASVSELAEPFPITVQAVSKHLRERMAKPIPSSKPCHSKSKFWKTGRQLK